MTTRKKVLEGQQLLAAIQEASRGLVYISETDSPFLAIFEAGQEDISLTDLVIAKTDGKGRVATGSAAAFFDRLTREREWHGESDRKSLRRFAELYKLLSENLDDLTMYRVGHIQVDILILGRDVAGNIAGIRTYAVET